MARNTRQFSDLNLFFTSHPSTKDVTKKFDEEAVKASIRNLISTKNYERPFHPEIGCQIFSLLFEDISPITIQVMRRTIFQVIEKFEPRAAVLDVKIRALPDNNSISVDVIFKVINAQAPITLNVNLVRVR